MKIVYELLNGVDCIYYRKIEDKLLAPFKIFNS